jgi:DNA-directed RNA polymerase subunit A"
MFDGDEMNLHAPQSVEAATELREIAAVPKQLISPRLSKPLVSVVQDTLVGVNRLTRPTEFFTRREYMNLLVHSKRWDGRIPPPAKTDPVPLWSGQQVVSALLPAIHLSMGNKMWDSEKGKSDPNYVSIKNGVITNGILDGDVFDKALIHILYNDFSPEMTVDFIDSLQAVVATYLQNSGFSVGLSDLVADSDTLNTISTDMEELKKKIESIQLQVHMGLFDNTTGRTNQEEFESKIFQTLDKAIAGAGKTGLKSLTSTNRMVNMVKCGSKGSDLNIAQMIALLGQQSIEGKRIAYGFQDRTLPHFKRYDDGATARGFIENSFVKGLSPAEFFFHAMTGREGLIDTAVKSVTGDTPIVVLENGVSKTVRIGDWIDAHLAERKSDVEYFPEEADLEMLQLNTPTYIPSVSTDGTITWGTVAAVTRHDPGHQLYRVETLGGRSVIVTASKSLLIWNPVTKCLEQRNTPDVRPGDAMPVTMSLPEPPVTVTHISVSQYLPKTDYLYGSDFHMAQTVINEAMIDRERIPAGWWDTNNGVEFTLPYENKGRFVRTLHRSSIDNIQPGYVYPFTSNRDGARIPEQFELNKTNGVFLGLFLAEGNVDVKSGYVGITNNSPAIRQFVHDWFEEHRIRTSEETHINAIGGTTTTVRGYSVILAKLLDKIVGHGAANKRVPDEAFAAPLEFIKGLLDGYISGDGTLTHNSIEAGSASKALIEGIVMLLTRIGVFAKLFESQMKSNNLGTEVIQPTYRMSVRAQWATRLASQIHFHDETKEQKRVELCATQHHRNFPVQNDVVLDEIVSIELVSPDAYPKMYDLTVPDTFTFGLANGLQVYDTADSGYMQRQLVKTMEDLMTHHDGTVRDAGGIVVQFAYGDDGTSATKIENQPIGLADMAETDLRARFTVDDVATEKSQGHIARVIADRDMLVRNVWGGQPDKTVQSAVHLPRLIANAVQQLGLEPGKGQPVAGAHVLETIDNIHKRTRADNHLWGALLRFHLNPRDIKALGFTRAAFDWLAEQIVIKHMKSWVAPGEMAGIIAAQSLGEPTTQMSAPKQVVITSRKIKNLKNSSDGNENYYVGPIGDFIDRLMTENSHAIVDLGHGSTVLDTSDWAIMGVSDNEKTSWKPISQISRHPANGGLVKVTTKSGRSTTATLSHSFLRRTTNGIAEIKGADLEVGMRIPVAYRMPEAPDALVTYNNFVLNKDFGWLVGMYVADGSFSGNTVKITKIHPIVEERIRAISELYGWNVTVRNYAGQYGPSKETNIYSKELRDTLMTLAGTGSYDKHIGAPIFHANRDFIAGVLSGYFDGDGNVNAKRQQIRAGSRSQGLIRGIARLLAVAGVFASIKEETSVRMPDQVMYTVNVIRKHAAQFKAAVGFNMPEKAEALDEIIAYNARFEAHSAREDLDLIPEVGDVVAETGRLLKIPGQSRTYGRWGSDRPAQKTAIGRRTLETYIGEFREMMAIHVDADRVDRVRANLAILESAVKSDVIWDEIMELEVLPDPHEMVYDFTVPGNDSFMVDDNIFVHNTLNTFHLSGVAAKSGMTRGVPRLKELLKATQNPKATSLTIHLRPDIRSSKEDARRLAQDLEFTMLKDLVTTSRIYYDPRDDDTLIAEDRDWLSFFAAFEQEAAPDAERSPWIIRLELDREKMFNKNITVEDINYVLREANSDIQAAYTDHNATRMVFRIRTMITNGGLNDLAVVKALQNKLLTQTLVRGLPGLRSVSFRKTGGETKDEVYEKNPANDNRYEAVPTFVLDTFGTNFLDVLVHPDIDGTKLISNHVHDIYENLGIEAARQILFREIFTLFEQAAPVNYRHVSILCDAMCNRGRMMSADRIGVNKKTKIGPLAKASFEQTEDIMLRAALFGEMDPVTGVSANIMTGQPIRGGTTFTQVLLDETALQEFVASSPEPRKMAQRAPRLDRDAADQILERDEQPGCRQEDLRIPVALPPMDPHVVIEGELPDLEIMLV